MQHLCFASLETATFNDIYLTELFTIADLDFGLRRNDRWLTIGPEMICVVVHDWGIILVGFQINSRGSPHSLFEGRVLRKEKYTSTSNLHIRLHRDAVQSRRRGWTELPKRCCSDVSVLQDGIVGRYFYCLAHRNLMVKLMKKLTHCISMFP